MFSGAGTLRPGSAVDAGGVLQAAGLLFFAFAGYARLATLGEEVRDPARTIPRAIAVTFVLVVALYAVAALALVHVLGATALADSARPFVAGVDAVGRRTPRTRVVVARRAGRRRGAPVPDAGRLPDCPRDGARRSSARVSCRGQRSRRVPHLAEIAVGLVVALVLPRRSRHERRVLVVLRAGLLRDRQRLGLDTQRRSRAARHLRSRPRRVHRAGVEPPAPTILVGTIVVAVGPRSTRCGPERERE